MYTYRTKGVCSQLIQIELDGDVVKDVKFIGGCSGNLQAISKLVAGMSVDQVISILEGNTCGTRPTSCADQLTRGLREARAAQAAQA